MDPPSDPSARLEIVTERLTQQVVDHEPELRATLRLALGPASPKNDGMPLRQGRGIYWIEDALSPLRGHLSETEIHRLVLAIRATIGIEALVWLTDVGGLSRSEAIKTMRWSAQALLRSALEDAPARSNLDRST